MHLEQLTQEFRGLYGDTPHICRAPGRVNLIGEHTDYNDGFVMPVAIDLYTHTAVTLRDGSLIRVQSGENEESYGTTELKPKGNWADYVAGVFAQLFASGLPRRGADVLVHGEVPVGAGLSSSAALEVATALAALRAANQSMDMTQVALLCQRAENQFVGAQCGIMDQFTSSHGKAGHALLLDCRSLEFSLLPIPTGVSVLILNTMVKHSLSGGEYNVRRSQCNEGVRLLAAKLPGIRALRDVSLADFEEHAGDLPYEIAKRCRHVITENSRVQRAAEALKHNDLVSFGKLMAESHASLKDDYEVSCSELDLMVELASKVEGVFGARMTGGGFGGCTVNLVRSSRADAIALEVQKKYEQATGIHPDFYLSQASDGASEVA